MSQSVADKIRHIDKIIIQSFDSDTIVALIKTEIGQEGAIEIKRTYEDIGWTVSYEETEVNDIKCFRFVLSGHRF